MGSSALPAGGHLVHGDAPGRLVKRAAGGESTLQERRARACCVRSVSRRDDGWTSVEPTCGACSRARAAYSRGTSNASPSIGSGQRLADTGRSLLNAGFALRRGLSATPRSPVGSRKNLSHTGCPPACLELPNIITGARRVQNPGEGVENTSFPDTSGCDRSDTFGDECGRRLRTADAAICRRTPGGARGSLLAGVLMRARCRRAPRRANARARPCLLASERL